MVLLDCVLVGLAVAAGAHMLVYRRLDFARLELMQELVVGASGAVVMSALFYGYDMQDPSAISVPGLLAAFLGAATLLTLIHLLDRDAPR